MGRKYSSASSSDDGLPELDDFINNHVKLVPALRAPQLNPTIRTAALASPERSTAPRSTRKTLVMLEQGDKSVETSKGRAKRGMKTHSALPRDSSQSALFKTISDSKTTSFSNATKLRATPHRKARNVAPVVVLLDSDEDEAFMTAEEKETSDIEESIWCDSDAESEVPAPREPKEDILSQFKKLQIRNLTPELSDDDEDLDTTIFRTRSPRKPLTTYRSPARKLELPSKTSLDSSDKENDSNASLKLPPLTLPKPGPKATADRPVTPPASPSKSKLVSPSKKKSRIPTPPHRPSIDAFWNPHAVNDWNDQYSPQKPLVSPRKNRFLPRDDDDSSDSPTTSPRKSSSPTKRSRSEIQARRDFETQKHKICEDFFAELDEKVTGGQIKELAESTGGVRFIWSKTLNSTAGRANWRKQTEKKTDSTGAVVLTYHHHASIELAEKVIDDQERLLNVVAHEFCHLANFMVSGIKDQPHGRQFKVWGAKCTKLFADRGVEVTTKHSYQIDYKYIWSCTNELCQQDFKRHSKSIDPARHTCGVCRAKLVQVKPVPRKTSRTGAASAGKVVGGYASFVKLNFASIKAEMAGASHKEVMQALGQRYREQKATNEAAAAANEAKSMATSTSGVDDMSKALEVVSLD